MRKVLSSSHFIFYLFIPLLFLKKEGISKLSAEFELSAGFGIEFIFLSHAFSTISPTGILEFIPGSFSNPVAITVIATGFEKESGIGNNIPVGEIVEKAWDKKINSIPNPTDNSNQADNLDIPSFLRNKRGINK